MHHRDDILICRLTFWNYKRLEMSLILTRLCFDILYTHLYKLFLYHFKNCKLNEASSSSTSDLLSLFFASAEYEISFCLTYWLRRQQHLCAVFHLLRVYIELLFPFYTFASAEENVAGCAFCWISGFSINTHSKPSQKETGGTRTKAGKTARGSRLQLIETYAFV